MLSRSLEDEWEEFEVERQNYRYAKLALGQLFYYKYTYGNPETAISTQYILWTIQSGNWSNRGG